jgi:hypothetical protein
VLDPIIITGVPRSRTSMTTALLHFCGLQLGKVSGPSSNNKKGQFENREIIDKVEKFYLKKFKYDPMGQYPIPEPKKLPIDTNRRQVVLSIVKKQGVDTTKIWGFKDSKSILSLYSWLNAFPNSKWIIVNRKKEDIAKSCELTPFMKKRTDWLSFVDDYRHRFNILKKEHNQVYEVNSDDIVAFNFDKLKFIVEEIGLTWNENMIREFVDPKLTRL